MNPFYDPSDVIEAAVLSGLFQEGVNEFEVRVHGRAGDDSGNGGSFCRAGSYPASRRLG
jgi:hypothetical protein